MLGETSWCRKSGLAASQNVAGDELRLTRCSDAITGELVAVLDMVGKLKMIGLDVKKRREEPWVSCFRGEARIWLQLAVCKANLLEG